MSPVYLVAARRSGRSFPENIDSNGTSDGTRQNRQMKQFVFLIQLQETHEHTPRRKEGLDGTPVDRASTSKAYQPGRAPTPARCPTPSSGTRRVDRGRCGRERGRRTGARCHQSSRGGYIRRVSRKDGCSRVGCPVHVANVNLVQRRFADTKHEWPFFLQANVGLRVRSR